MARAKDNTRTPKYQLNPDLGHRFVYLIERLIDLHPDIDAVAFVDSLEGAKSEEEAWRMTLRTALDDEAMAGALRTLIQDRTRRLARLEAQSRAKRQLVCEGMRREELGTLRDPEFLATLSDAPPEVAVLDAEQIPAQFVLARDVKIDHDAILKVLTKGGHVPGVELAAPRETIVVRTR